MAYNCKVIEIIIASPGDVAEERQIVREIIADWNAVYARERAVVLLPIGWETHSSPELSGRPQQLINDRLLAHADILVGIFWTRVGSPTGKAISGSIEEIDEHRKQGKPVMLYFSNVPVALESVDRTQYEELTVFKKWAMNEGLVEFFDSRDDFREKFRHQLPLTLRDNPHIKTILKSRTDSVTTAATDVGRSGSKSPEASADAREILIAAAADRNGMVLIRKAVGGTNIQAGGKQFGDSGNHRSIARWEAAVNEVHEKGLVKDLNGTRQIFQITDAGYRLVEGET